jgi:hypothetical protein
MRTNRYVRGTCFGLLVLLLIPAALPAHAATIFASPAFQQQWQQGESIVTNFWGPLGTASSGINEPYKEGSLGVSESGPMNPGQGQRLVQYFDKGRMELTHPAQGLVTNGLLTVELITGKVQLGDNTFEQRQPAAVPAVGDPDNAFPTYADLQAVTKPQAVDSLGLTHSYWQLNPGGQIVHTDMGADDPLTVENVADLNRYRVPKAFVDFRTRVGFLTIGYAVTQPMWVTAKVAGRQTAILVQGFERRVLTYTPSNPAAFRVEFGNIGQHYLAWRYNGKPPTAAT